MTQAAGVDTTSPTDIRLEPEVIDMLPSRASLPEELSKFCFPDDIYLSTEPFSPRTFDIVLTGACIIFKAIPYRANSIADDFFQISRGFARMAHACISVKRSTPWMCFL